MNKFIEQRPIISLISVRVLILLGLSLLFGMKEISSDIRYFEMMYEHPFGILLGIAPIDIAPYGPLEPILFWLLYKPLDLILPKFLSIRIFFLIFEVGGIYFLLKSLPESLKTNNLLKWILFLSPAGIFTSLVLPQDEVIMFFFSSLSYYFLSKKMGNTSLLLLGLGICFSRIFLVVPLFVCCLFLKHDNIFKRFFWGFFPVVFIYSLLIFFNLQENGKVMMTAFTTNALFSVNLWPTFKELFNLSPTFSKNFSIILAGFGTFTLIAINLKRSHKDKEVYFLALITLLIFFNSFYQLNPEYLIVFNYLLIPFLTKLKDIIFLQAVVFFTWIVNIIYGLRIVEQFGGTGFKMKLLSVAKIILPFENSMLYFHRGIVAISGILLLTFMVKLINDFRKSINWSR